MNFYYQSAVYAKILKNVGVCPSYFYFLFCPGLTFLKSGPPYSGLVIENPKKWMINMNVNINNQTNQSGIQHNECKVEVLVLF